LVAGLAALLVLLVAACWILKRRIVLEMLEADGEHSTYRSVTLGLAPKHQVDRPQDEERLPVREM
jgi:hypothetical protein